MGEAGGENIGVSSESVSNPVETRTYTFAKAPEVNGPGEFVSVEAHQRYANQEAAYAAEQNGPVRPEMVDRVELLFDQAWMARPSENPLPAVIFAAKYEGWTAAEVMAALARAQEKGDQLQLKRVKLPTI